MKLLLISSVNLTTNPRIYKELKLAYALGYQITFIGFKLGNWSDAGDVIIKKEFPSVQYIYLDATRGKYITWLYYSLLHVLFRYIWLLRKNSLLFSAIAHSKRTFLLIKVFRSLNNKKYDLISAHTLAALYPSFYLAKKMKSKFSFDVEDFHPGERIFSDENNERKRRELLMEKILPLAFYVSAASPMISKKVEELACIKVLSVLNYFPKNEFKQPSQISGFKMKLVWFSQNISANRGLELLLSVWGIAKENFELTLIGKIDNIFYETWIKSHQEIIIKPPLPQKLLHEQLSSYDIGLAIDIDVDDYNRKIAITNKIVAYFQSGLYILATRTLAQNNFIQTYPTHGILSEQTSSSIQNSLIKIFSQKERIRANNKQRFEDASRFSWEIESEVIKKAWEEC